MLDSCGSGADSDRDGPPNVMPPTVEQRGKRVKGSFVMQGIAAVFRFG